MAPINSARQHHYERGNKRNYCILCREMQFKIGELPDSHPNDINAVFSIVQYAIAYPFVRCHHTFLARNCG